MKKFIEYTTGEIALVCKGMRLRTKDTNTTYIMESHPGRENKSSQQIALYLAVPEIPSERHCSWYTSACLSNTLLEDLEACELAMYRFFNQGPTKSRLELVVD